METKKFQALTLEDALEKVRQEWGPEAIVLHVEQLIKRNGLFKKGETQVEITAQRPTTYLNSTSNSASTGEISLNEELCVLRDEVFQYRLALQQIKNIQWARKRLDDQTLQHPMIDFMMEKGMTRDYATEWVVQWLTKSATLDLSECAANLELGLPRLTWEDVFPQKEGRCTLFLGLPGSGKTLLLLKIAARMRLLGDGNVKLVCADISRPGPSEQLALYSEILQIPIIQLFDLDELKKISEETPSETHLLIDWNGFSPYKTQSWQELEKLDTLHVHPQVILTASLASDLRNWEHFQNDFSNLPMIGLALTQADLEHRFGKIWEASRRTHLPIAFFSTGKNIPGDFFDGRSFPFGKHFFHDYKSTLAEKN